MCSRSKQATPLNLYTHFAHVVLYAMPFVQAVSFSLYRVVCSVACFVGSLLTFACLFAYLNWHGTGHVLNRIATAQQAQIPNAPFLATARQLVAAGGPRELYKGLRWNLLSSCCKAGTRWTLTASLYHAADTFVPPPLRSQWFWSDSVAVAVAAALVETTFVLTPLESLRTLEMTTSLSKHRQVVRDSINGRGLLKTLTAGWDRVFVRQLTSWVSYLVAYDQIKAVIIGNPTPSSDPSKVVPHTPSKPATFAQKAAVGIGTGAIACVFTTPLDMLRTQAQMDSAPNAMRGLLSLLLPLHRHVQTLLAVLVTCVVCSAAGTTLFRASRQILARHGSVVR